jgi:uncharacterized protein YkwD/chitodextrinase
MRRPHPISLLPLILSGIFLIASHNAAAADPIAHQITLPVGQSWCADSMINGLLSSINSLRAQRSLPALKMDALGMKDAEMRAVQFAAYMEANPPGSPGFNPHQGYDTTAASLGYDLWSENLAYGPTDPGWVASIWTQDYLHLGAMLTSYANVAGVSCIYSYDTPYWTFEPGYSASGGTSTPTTPTLDSEEWAFLSLLNAYRAQNGAGALQVSVALQNSARWMSTDMAQKNYFSHTDSLGRSPQTRIASFGYPAAYSAGENLAAGFPDAQSVLEGFANACDPDGSGNCTYAHRRNMLGAGYTAIGIARVSGYWTTDFGSVVEAAVTPPGTTQPPAALPSVASFSASPSAITAGQSATLIWNVTGAATITIDNGVGTVSSATSAKVAPTKTTTYTLTASNTVGSVTARVAVTVAAAADTQPPTVPGNVSAIAKSSTTVSLSWKASTDNVAVTGYQIVRNGSVIASVAAGVLSYTDSTVTAGSAYSYAIRALDAAGNSSSSTAVQVTTPAAASAGGTCPQPASGAYTGCYYNNTTLGGSPILSRTDRSVDFNWDYLGRDPALPGSFSARWQGNFTFAQGSYTFNVVASDGMRVYLDGTLVLNKWYDQGPMRYSFQQTMAAGSHLVTVEYYERSGTPVARLVWQSTAPAVELPVVGSFTASPASIASGQSSNLTWSVSGATSVTISGGVGSVANSGSKTVAPAQTTTYTLTASNSGGSATALTTVTVTGGAATTDSQPPTAPASVYTTVRSAALIDVTWTPSTDNVAVAGYRVLRNGTQLATVPAPTTTYSDRTVSGAVSYTYSVRAYDAAGNLSVATSAASATTPAAPATPTGACPGPASNAFTGCFYPNIDLAGSPVVIRTDPQIGLDWARNGFPAALSPTDFSARWQGSFSFDGGTYTFTAVTSDGMRIFIDGAPVMDRWRDQARTLYNVRQNLSPGAHTIVVEYYGSTGAPTASLSWKKQ